MKHLLLIITIVSFAACRSSAPRSLETSQVAQAQVLDGGSPSCPSDGGTCVPISSASELGAACLDERWIAIPPPEVTGCPKVTDATGGVWREEPLFPPPPLPETVPPGLARYCVYNWESSDPERPPDTATLKAALAQASLSRDCMVVGPLGSSAAIDAGWEGLHADFHQQTGWWQVLPIDSAKPPAHVRVAVLDSTPTGFERGTADTGQSSHGFVVGRLIRELGCPSDGASGKGACIAQLANHLALPRVDRYTVDRVHGGYFGLQTETALALYMAVRDWRTHNATTGLRPHPRLVVNLSIGWDGRYGGPYPDDQVWKTPPAARAVHDALWHAVCHGALVFAAAGNDPGGPEVFEGPMYPGGWEMKPAPTAQQCATFEGAGYPPNTPYPIFPPPNTNHYRPLVYAVGGVRGDDEPLANTRPKGRPRLAAPGFKALGVTPSSPDGGSSPTDLLTGTSAATAVASGIAATVWGYRPLLTAPEIVQLMRKGSVDLDLAADFCLGGANCSAAGGIRRVSLCNAVREACSGALENCPLSLPPCNTPPPYSRPMARLTPEQRAYVEALATRHDPTDGGTQPFYVLSPVEVCGHRALYSTAPQYTKVICPFRQFYGRPMRPYTHPQPEADPCPACETMVQSDEEGAYSATFYLGIDSDYKTTQLQDLSILLEGDGGIYEINLPGLGPFTGGDEIMVEGVPIDPSWLPLDYATVNFHIRDGTRSISTMSELSIIQ